MGKAKARHSNKFSPKHFSKVTKPLSKGVSKRPNSAKKPTSATPPTSTIPFDSADRILLVGEGDFSFSASLLQSHGCFDLVCTSFDDRQTCLTKYPQSSAQIEILEAEDGCIVLFGVDATKLGKPGAGAAGGGRILKRGLDGHDFDKIVFNFPHVGGLTKDVHRQTRHNQELLLGFFCAALPLLRLPSGQIIVTTFEGEPYQSWDLRGLARQAGLKVERSFQFHASSYPGYKHARTLGNIEGGGGWKGEDRRARSYLLQADLESDGPRENPKKRRRDESESDSG